MIGQASGMRHRRSCSRGWGLAALGLAVYRVVSVLGGCANVPVVASMMPTEIHGWTPRGQDAVYDRDTLFDYIDGGAEVYRSFHVRRVLARSYIRPDQPEIVADIFEMESPADAYGVYHHDLRQEATAGVGNDSEYLEGALQFWKGPFFVSVFALEETEASSRAVVDLGRAIASAIPEAGSPPDLLDLLPVKDRLKGRVRYFHDHTCLNSYYFLADDNLLNLHARTEGVLATYRSHLQGDKGPVVLLVVRYPTVQEAKAAHGRFLAGYLPEADPHGLACVEGGRWVGARSAGNLLAAVLDAASRVEVESMLASVLAWAEGEKDR